MASRSRRFALASLVCCFLANLAASLPAGELTNSQTMSSSSSVSASFSSSSVQQSASASVSSSADKKQLIKTTTTTTTTTTTDAAPIVIPLDETEKQEAQPAYQEPQPQPEPEPKPEPEPEPEPKPVEPVDTDDATDLQVQYGTNDVILSQININTLFLFQQDLQKPNEDSVLTPVEETKANVEEETSGNSIQQQQSVRPAAENRGNQIQSSE